MNHQLTLSFTTTKIGLRFSISMARQDKLMQANVMLTANNLVT